MIQLYFRRVSFFLFIILTLSGCSTDGVGRYRVESIGNAQRAVKATVVTFRPAYIAKDTSGAGAAMGGSLGAALTSNNSDNAGVIIAGIIGGLVIGNAIEAQQNVHEATEYVLKTDYGALLTVAQINKGNQIFKEGDQVVLVYGYPARLIGLKE